MSIYFNAEIELQQWYEFEGEEPTPKSTLVKSSFDLGNSRILRSILEDSEDYCGTKSLNSSEFMMWLAGVVSQTNNQIHRAAYATVKYLSECAVEDGSYKAVLNISVSYA